MLLEQILETLVILDAGTGLSSHNRAGRILAVWPRGVATRREDDKASFVP